MDIEYPISFHYAKAQYLIPGFVYIYIYQTITCHVLICQKHGGQNLLVSKYKKKCTTCNNINENIVNA